MIRTVKIATLIAVEARLLGRLNDVQTDDVMQRIGGYLNPPSPPH